MRFQHLHLCSACLRALDWSEGGDFSTTPLLTFKGNWGTCHLKGKFITKLIVKGEL